MHHHHHDDYVDTISKKGPAELSGKMKGIFILMMVVGFGTFIATTFLNEGQERVGWISFLHNFYFFTGLSAASVALAAIMQVTRSHWGRAVKRFAEAGGAFLPFAPIFMVVLFFGMHEIYEWVAEPVNPEAYHNKAMWLQKDFFFVRILAYLIILNFLAYKFRSISLRSDQGLAHEKYPSLWPKPANWAGTEREVAQNQPKQSRWAVFYCIGYPVFVSLLAYELIMSLDYRWVSTMFGGWNFTTFILIAWGTLYFNSAVQSSRFGVSHYIHKLTYHDIGKLTFGFTVVWGYLFFAQYMVIWYGNYTFEAGYLITRFFGEPWRPIALVTFAMVWLLPFILGLSKKIKMSFKTFWPVIALSFLGVWLEMFVLIAPASWYYNRMTGEYDPGVMKLLFMDALVALGFLGMYAMLYLKALYKNPIMAISDPRLAMGINRH